MAQESLGEPSRAQESPGEPRRAQECPGKPRRAQENLGEPRRAPEFAFRDFFRASPLGYPYRRVTSLPFSPGQPRKAQEDSGEPRRAQESPGDFRKAQKSPGKPRTAQDSSGDFRTSDTPRIRFQEPFFARPPWAILIGRATSLPLLPRTLGLSQNSLSGIFFRASP
eukprot:11854522-Karenia_brevis.AAC.1